MNIHWGDVPMVTESGVVRSSAVNLSGHEEQRYLSGVSAFLLFK